jgi:predicted unusual protein kinase regulating ubiquinone biosynthesis (AarF/ABC1/UbiB family)
LHILQEPQEESQLDGVTQIFSILNSRPAGVASLGQ